MNSPFEAGMLICFGISWPFSIAKSIRTRVVAGKSRSFMVIVAFGYICGIAHKLLFARDFILILYIMNLLLVCIDLVLYYRYRARISA